MANASRWLDMAEIDHTWTKNGEEIELEQAKEFGAGKFAARIHFFLEEPTKMLAWFCLVPMDVEELEKAVGQHNINKETIPVLAFPLEDENGKKLKVPIMPTEDDKGYGLGLLAFINATRAEGEARPSPTSYWKATRSLSAVGLWPNKSLSSNLLSKIGRYGGGMETYSAPNKKKRSWYKVEEATMTSQEGNQAPPPPFLLSSRFKEGHIRLLFSCLVHEEVIIEYR